MSGLDDPTYLGTVQDVTGSTLHIALDERTLSGLTFLGGHGYRIGQIGAFVRIPLGYLDLFGIVSQVGAGAAPARLVEQKPHGDRWMTVQLAGQSRRDGAFERGVAEYPTIGDAVHLVVEEDLRRIYGKPDHPQYVRVGGLAAAPAIPALIDIDRLVTRHSAVVGATGSGKSTTVAGLLTALSDVGRYPSARIIIIDVHGEYSRALGDRAAVFRVGANARRNQRELNIPYWALNFDELSAIAFGAIDETARVTLADKITDLKRESLAISPRAGVSVDTVTADTPIPFSIKRLWWDIHTATRSTHHERPNEPQSEATWALELDDQNSPIQPGDMSRVIPPRFRPLKDERGDPEKIRLSSSTLKVGRSVDILAGRLRDQRLGFLFNPDQWSCDHNGVPQADLDSLMEQWIGGSTPVTILDLSGAPPSIQGSLVGALLRVIYEALFWARNLPEGGRNRPLLIVLEEAHAYLNANEETAASVAVKRIAKEGRKYGMGVMIVSQRPSEIDPTILSQCGTLIALRLSNASDRAHIKGAVSDGLDGLLSSLPILRTGEAIILGEAVSLPMRALISKPAPGRAPDSQDPAVVSPLDEEMTYRNIGGWNQESIAEDYSRLVSAWRSQSVHSSDPEGNRMEWHAVSSSNIDRIGYNADTSELGVEFSGQSIYIYLDVPDAVFNAFLSSGSKGSFFHSNIRNRYRFSRES